MARAEIVVDLGAIRDNVATLRAMVDRPVMAVVKADGYGHGLLPSARAVLAGGADMLGVALLDEALALRQAGVTAPLLCWLAVPGEELTAAVRLDVDVSVSAPWAVAELRAAALAAGRPARVHVKMDSGLSRGGATSEDWPELVAAVLAGAAAGELLPIAVWSHFAYADAPGHPTVARQLQVFTEAADWAEGQGLTGVVRHLANSAATLTSPAAWLGMVRPGIACYGLDPHGGNPAAYGLRPAMTVRAEVALVKRVGAGSGVSYGHEYTTTRPTTLALVPVGYAEGIPRNATNVGPVLLGGQRRRISGRVCMDQFVVDVGDDDVRAGAEVVLWGPGTAGEPTAQDWAEAVGTIHYELVTRVGGRMTRRYVGAG